MAWVTPRCWTTGEVVTAALLNAQIKGNMDLTAPAKLTSAGDMLYSTGANAPARLAKGTNGNILHQASCAPAWTATPSITDLTLSGALDVNGTIDYDGTDVDMLSSGDIDLVSSANAAAAVYIAQSTGTSGTIKIHADTGTSVTEGAESINILSDAGGVGIRSTANLANAINITADGCTASTIQIYNDAGTAVNEGVASIQLLSDVGGIGIKSGLDAAGAIRLTADAGTSETIILHSDLGTGEGSITLTSDAGGIDLNAAAGKDIALDSGQVLITATHNTACTIYLHANGGTAETIKIHSDQGTSESSITILSDAGGINIDAPAAKDIDIAGGTINLTSSDDAGSAVYIRANAGTSETIKIHADQGSGEGSIELTSDAGGIDLNAAAGKDIDLAGGQINLTGSHDTANTIYLRANAGTSETIKIHSDLGTSVTEGAASVSLISDAGGVELRSTANLANAINLTVDSGTTSSIAIFNDTGNATGSICLKSDVGGITLNPATFVTVGGNATNAGEVRILEDTDNGSNYVALKAPNVSTSYTMTLPTAVAGTCGFVLTSTTAGVTSWAAAGAGSNKSAKVTHDADQSTSTGSEMTVAFNTETFDTDSMADTANRLTFTTAGTYLVQAYVQIEGNTAGRRHIAFRLNGSGDRLAVVQSAPSLADQWGNIVSLLIAVNATDYIEVRFLQTSGSTLAIQAGNGSPWLSAVKILG